MYEVILKGEIASAHFLRGYPGKCKDIHGHTWKIDVYLAGEKLDALGMLQDFAVLKVKLKDFLDTLDHKNLNELSMFAQENPTAENIARHIFFQFQKSVAPLKVSKVTVWESDKAGVSYYE